MTSLNTEPATAKKPLRGLTPLIAFFHTHLGVSVTTMIALMLPTAVTFARETRDLELEALIKKVEKTL